HPPTPPRHGRPPSAEADGATALRERERSRGNGDRLPEPSGATRRVPVPVPAAERRPPGRRAQCPPPYARVGRGTGDRHPPRRSALLPGASPPFPPQGVTPGAPPPS